MPSPRIRPLILTLVAAGALAAACYNDPQRQMDQMQQITDLADILNEVQLRTADMQATLDSLQMVVAKQDSTIYRLANLAGVPYSR
jgi:hypothetical protein